jgi:hypothetical protein
MDWFDKTVALVWLVLTYQQNRILRAGNPSLDGRRHPWFAQIAHYWPTFMGVLVIGFILLRPVLSLPSRAAREGSGKSRLIPWFQNDGLKWRIAQALRADINKRQEQILAEQPLTSRVHADPCYVLIIHYDTTYSLRVSKELKSILDSAGCSTKDNYAQRQINDGISIKVGNSNVGTNPTYAKSFQSQLQEMAYVTAPYNIITNQNQTIPEIDSNCVTPGTLSEDSHGHPLMNYSCFALEVGNEPEP